MGALRNHYLFNDAALVGYWPLDGNFNDAGPNAYNLTPTGTPGDTVVKYGGAKSFVYATVYAQISNASGPNLNITGANISVGCWIYPTNMGLGFVYPMSKRDGANTGYYLALESGTLVRMYIGNGTTSTSATGATTLLVNTKYFIVGTWDGTTIRVYLNGIQDGSVALAGTIGSSSGQPFCMGLNSLNTAEGFTGSVDDAFVFSKTLTPAEILSLYNNGNDLNNYKFIQAGDGMSVSEKIR